MRTTYTCDKCGTESVSRSAIVKCEKSHCRYNLGKDWVAEFIFGGLLIKDGRSNTQRLFLDTNEWKILRDFLNKKPAS